MQQGFTNAQIRGTLVLLILIAALFFFSFLMRRVHEKQEVLTKEEERLMDSLLCIVPPVKPQKQKYTSYPSSKKYYPTHKPTSTKPKTINLSFDLNQVDSLQLLSLPGIGPVLSGRILKFRKALGGFYHKEQLYELWGIDSTATKKLLPYFYIKEDDKPLCINVNTADYYTLKDHPYISPTEASAIMKQKKKRGKFLSLSELEPMLVQFNKLKYYLCLE